MIKYIEIRGARLHNLKNINVKIPHSELVVITGPSGSGKSSLAFDTLFAEGQRRYVESLSTYARQFLEKMPKPEVESITGICPAIAIQQKTPSGNPRSTVGTVTEIYDYLRLLFARIGKIFCYQCGARVKKEQSDDVIQYIESLPEKNPFFIAFPIRLSNNANISRIKDLLISQGFLRIWHQGRIIDLRKDESFNSELTEVIVVVDRGTKTSSMDRLRLKESIETAFKGGEGFMYLILSNGEMKQFNQQLICKHCGTKMVEPEPRLFSFNNPFGACPGCQGFGDMMDLDINKIVPDPTKSLRQGAIAPWTTPAYRHFMTQLFYAAARHNIPMDVPFQELSREHKDYIINGGDNFIGVRGFFKKLEGKKYKIHVRVFISRYRSYFTCTECGGQRLRPEALAVKIQDRNISELVNMTVADLYQFLENLKISEYEQQIAGQLLQETRNRLRYLIDVGLEYLNLNRRANTLSGGEFQRINLATALGSALSQTLYILDEPTIGLHPRDVNKLVNILKSLVVRGNTVVVVEHEKRVVENAGYMIDLGPAAGENGGQVMFQGNFSNFLKSGNSLTAQYFRKEKRIPLRNQYRKSSGKSITIIGAREHNLKNITVEIPLGIIVCITGVSGSGKSTLVEEILYRGYLAYSGQTVTKIGDHDAIRGLHQIDRMEMVDQSPIGRTPRSNPVTYIKAFDDIRKIFASTPAARAHGYSPGHFSFNVPGGRCEVCQGDGQIKIEMQFLADVYLPCEACQAKRYKPEILNVHYHGKNIHDILEMTVDQAIDFFHKYPSLANKLKMLQKVGLGYLKLGQPATTLSGGEAQRIKLAAHLSRKSHRNVLFIFDEPTTGLHFHDISKLLNAFDELIKGGASILLIEHNLDMIQYADWIIDLGPEGGDRGGRIVAQGNPREIAANPHSYTGQFLKEYFAKMRD